MRRAAAVMAKMKLPEKNFQPSQTLVGVQEIGNKFTAVTSVQGKKNAIIKPLLHDQIFYVKFYVSKMVNYGFLKRHLTNEIWQGEWQYVSFILKPLALLSI